MADIKSLIEIIYQSVGFNEVLRQYQTLQTRTAHLTKPLKGITEIQAPVGRFDELNQRFQQLVQTGEKLKGRIPQSVIERETSRVVPAIERYLTTSARFTQAHTQLTKAAISLSGRLTALKTSQEGIDAISQSIISRQRLIGTAFYRQVLGAKASQAAIDELSLAHTHNWQVSDKTLTTLGITEDQAKKLAVAYRVYNQVFSKYGEAQSLATKTSSAFATAQSLVAASSQNLLRAIRPEATLQQGQAYLKAGKEAISYGDAILKSTTMQQLLNINQGQAVEAANQYRTALARFQTAAKEYTSLLDASKKAGADNITIKQKLVGAGRALESTYHSLNRATGRLAEAHKQAVNLA